MERTVRARVNLQLVYALLGAAHPHAELPLGPSPCRDALVCAVMTGSLRIDLSGVEFAPYEVAAVKHDLVGHPLLELSAIVELAKRIGTVRSHDDQASPGTDFTTAPKTHAVARSPGELLADIENARAWVAVHNIQQDPRYAQLVCDVLESVRPRVDVVDPGMHARAGWIFVTSPGAVTPYHMDHEHNFILQIRGTKEIHVFSPMDRRTVSSRALECFHHDWSRELVKYDAAFEDRATVLAVAPGSGGYMPSTAPHWVQNGSEVSITVSFTYYTDETLRRAALHRANYKLRRMGIQPSCDREWTWPNRIKHQADSALRAVLGKGRRRAEFAGEA